MDACYQLINPILESLSLDNAQYPMLFFSGEGCTGKMYPPEGSFNLWDQDINESTVGFSTIRSMIIPPQTTLKIWSPNNESYYSIGGLSIIPDTSAYLANWSRWDGTVCNSTDVYCGKKINWRLGVDIMRCIPHNYPWYSYLAINAVGNRTLSLSTPSGYKSTYNFDYDTLYDELCKDSTNPACGCHEAYHELLANHPTSVKQSYVNITPNRCNPVINYVPTGANVGNNSISECTNMINAQLKAGTFPTLSKGGPMIYNCANRSFQNSYETVQEQNREVDFVANNTYVYIVMGVLLFISLVLVGIFYFQSSKRLKKSNTKKRYEQ